MSAPKRIQMSRQRPWRADNPDAVIVARPSKWGNPYRARRGERGWVTVFADEHGSPFAEPDSGTTWPDERAAVRDAVRKFRAGMVRKLTPGVDGFDPWMQRDLDEQLAGRDLACWCPLDQPCHADVLLEIANGAAS